MDPLTIVDLAFPKLGTTEDLQNMDIPSRSPNRPRYMRIDMDTLDASFVSFKGNIADGADDVSSAEYKLHSVSDSPRESIFSDMDAVSDKEEEQEEQEAEEEVDFTDFLDEVEINDAEICTITDVISYLKQSGSDRVQMVTL